MCRTQCVLVMVSLFVRLANSLSWEYVVATNTTLEFYKGSTLTHSEDLWFGIKHLTLDAVQNRLLFLDEEKSRKLFLHSLNLANMERQSFFMRKYENRYGNIISLAYDPATELVYFVDRMGIFWFSLKPGFKNNIYGNLLIEFPPLSFPKEIAVDSCRGYLYYTYIDGHPYPKISRVRLNGSDKEIVKVYDQGYMDFLVIDQETQKLYSRFNGDQYDPGLHYLYTDDKYGFIDSIDLNGERNLDRRLYTENFPRYSSITALTVSQDFIYWTHDKWGQNVTLWKLPKNGSANSDRIYTNCFIGPYKYLVANYKIEDQIRGVHICEALLTKHSVSNDNSVNFSEKETPVCQNYCFQGNCSVIDGQPICRCDARYSGVRCEENKCQEYCLNNADCYLNEESEPVCQCKGDYGGERCDVSVFLTKCLQTVSMLKDILNTDITPIALDYAVKSSCGTTIF